MRKITRLASRRRRRPPTVPENILSVNSARLAVAMVEMAMGRQELCDRAGVDTRTLKKALDHGEMIRFDSLKRLAIELQIPVVQLIVQRRQ